jgi:DNA-binding GntR family transcriptional regulator
LGSDFMAASTGSAAGLLDRKEKSVSQRAYERLLDMLIKREIPVGAVLQERRLAEHLDISRTPVREALSRLESAGFVIRKPGRMLVVKEFSTRELIETLHVRKILESESAGLAAGRIPPAELDALEAAIHALLRKASPSAEEDWAVDSRFHGLIGEHSGNTVLARTIHDLRVKTHMFNMDRVPERFETGHHEHLAVIEALRRGDRRAARERIETHIDNVKLSIIDKLSRI